ncbi:P-loop containing nucleoside triphosphate hydrolase protein [Mycena rebaudengoi]|nr:P-loop containing nucleoside triphosphate hydrolase protein [Mycena rebaudengoi]
MNYSLADPGVAQVVLGFPVPASGGVNTLLIPPCVAACSAFILLVNSVLSLKSVKSCIGTADEDEAAPGIGKGTILIYRIARLVACVALVALSIISLSGEHKTGQQEDGTRLQRVPYALTRKYQLYASLLALLSTSPTRPRQHLVRHANAVLFFAFAVYAYRDILPLATFTRVPADLTEGPILWAKISLLFAAAVVVPLFTPRQYIPVDPLNPTEKPNPEQTASIISFMLFFFLDDIISKGYRNAQLKEEDLYPLCDTDASEHLRARSFPHLDTFSGSKKRHIFFGLMRVFRVEYCVLSLLMVLRVLSNLRAQSQCSSCSASLEFQLYIFINTRTLVRTEAIITQLVFAHRQKPRRLPSRAPSHDADTVDEAESNADEFGRRDSNAAGELGSLTGKINNLFTTDLGNIVDGRDFLYLALYMPLQIAACIWFLHSLLGWAVWVGLGSIIALAPLPGLIAKYVQSVQRERLKRTDERVQSVSEAMNVLRMVKLFGWETKMKDRIAVKRDDELLWLRKRRLLDLLSQTVNFIIPVVTMTLVMGESLNASKVFSSITVFDMLRDNIAEVSWYLAEAVAAKTELLDAFEEKTAPALFPAVVDERIGFRNATFAWSKNETDGGALTRSRRDFLLKIEDEVIFERGRINLVVGPTGSGKTSLLHTLLGEMHWIPSTPESWYNLPRGDGVAYAAQESWVLNETIKDNIIFDTPFDEERYKTVLYQCALEPDLALFQAGDQTEVGEKGLTLSGGQKARLTLARAVYSTAGILLLDDVLAALDVHTAQWIVEKCFGGSLIKGRTVILVTHNVALARPIAHFVVTFGADGRVKSQGSIAELAKPWGALASQIRKDQQALDRVEQEVAAPATPESPVPKTDGKLIVAEEIQEGHVSAAADVPVLFYMSLFVGIVFVSTLTLMVVYTLLVFGQLRASKKIHKSLIESILSAPLRWLDVTPTSRIIARVTNDVRAVDDTLPIYLWPLATMFTSMLVKFVAVIIYTPIFFFPGLVVGAVGGWVGQVYMAGQLPVKRLMSNARAPVLAHFGAAIAGLVSIRAYGAQNKFDRESLSRIDRYTRAGRNFYNLNRLVGVRSIFSTALSTYLVYGVHTSAADTGFIISMSVTFTSTLLFAVRYLNDVEVQGNSLERIQSYVNIEHEKSATEAGTPPAYWPASGDLRVENLSARYSEDGPNVLHGVSFHVKSGERVGIVGRTGSGKSSLTLSLLRCIPTEGSVIYDGRETSELNLDALRSSITIIPQVPELLSGSLRANLDPFGQYDDAELNSALRAAGLFALQSDMDEGRITLDSAISAGGSNLSVGQRQIFALSRAIVRKSKVLLLDEATSAIDYKTDTIIQASLRQELPGDVSLITVAHRLQTIMDADKIMVLDAGRIVEFDSPQALLRIEGGKFRALVDESGDRDVLRGMAEKVAK